MPIQIKNRSVLKHYGSKEKTPVKDELIKKKKIISIKLHDFIAFLLTFLFDL